jgi:hypothetical protein
MARCRQSSAAAAATAIDTFRKECSETATLRLVCNSRTANRALEATGLRKHLPFADNLLDTLTNLV